MPHAEMSMPMSPSKDSNVPMMVKGINIRMLDDGTYILRCEKEGRKKDGMHVYDSKEYAYKTVQELVDDLKNDFLKRGLASRR